MPVHLFQHGSGKVCGKKLLPCSHRCSEGVGSNHVCVCNRKWTFDPGCGHKVTGTCPDFSKLGQPCLEWCRKVLNCGHPCLEPCESDTCDCQLCFDKHYVVTSDSDDDNKSETEKSSAITEMVAQPTLKLVSPKVPTTRKYRNARFASPQFPEKKVPLPQQAAKNGNGFDGLQNGFDNNKPCSSNMAYGNGNTNVPCTSKGAYGNTNGSAIPPPKQPQPATPVHGINNELYMDLNLNDDNAWKLGYAKCVNAHYFRAELRKCDICGKKTELQLPDGYYSDSDSD